MTDASFSEYDDFHLANYEADSTLYMVKTRQSEAKRYAMILNFIDYESRVEKLKRHHAKQALKYQIEIETTKLAIQGLLNDIKRINEGDPVFNFGSRDELIAGKNKTITKFIAEIQQYEFRINDHKRIINEIDEDVINGSFWYIGRHINPIEIYNEIK